MFRDKQGKLCINLSRFDNYYLVMQIFGRVFRIVKNLEMDLQEYTLIKEFNNIVDAVNYFETFVCLEGDLWK